LLCLRLSRWESRKAAKLPRQARYQVQLGNEGKDGNVAILNGELYSDGADPPASSEEYPIVICDEEVMAKVVVIRDGGRVYGHLWLAGSVVVAANPGEPGSGCAFVARDEEETPCAVIDEEGTLVLRRMLRSAGGALVRTVVNWPFSEGGPSFHE
jgi:hypothetical protein